MHLNVLRNQKLGQMSGEYTVQEGTCEIEPGDCGAVAEGLRCSPLSEARRGTAMINGTHVVVYSKDPESDRAFFRDVLKFPPGGAGPRWGPLSCAAAGA